MDAVKLITKHKEQENILWYLDPPYPPGVRTKANSHKYAFEMTDEQHKQLIDLILEVKGMVIISSYDNPIYRQLEYFGWRKEMKVYKNNTFQSGERIECIWINPQAQINQSKEVI
jgi:DNA adenine methylase